MPNGTPYRIIGKPHVGIFALSDTDTHVLCCDVAGTKFRVKNDDFDAQYEEGKPIPVKAAAPAKEKKKNGARKATRKR